MKIGVIGAGGVGGFYGGRLAHAGADVTFIARGAHLAAIREHGLLIENEPQGDIRVRNAKAAEDIAAVADCDLVIVAVKLWDTESVAQALERVIGPRTAVLSLQNGVIKDDILRRALGPARIMGGAGDVATHIARPGVIHQTGTMQRLVFGEYDGTRSPRAEALLELAHKAGFQVELAPDIRRTLWEKYTFLVGLSGATTTMRSTIGPIRSNPQSRAFLFDLMREVVAVGRAHGVSLPEKYAEQRLAFADTVPADMTSSMHHDLERGNRLEVPWLSGGVVDLGRAVGIEAPANRAVRDLLALYVNGRKDER
jgi:2-dehydropantoate 2-reductase